MFHPIPCNAVDMPLHQPLGPGQGNRPAGKSRILAAALPEINMNIEFHIVRATQRIRIAPGHMGEIKLSIAIARFPSDPMPVGIDWFHNFSVALQQGA
jgi:hypothetical protein